MTNQAPDSTPTPTRCARCGETFFCGARMDSCWCQQLPPLEPGRVDPGSGCYCPDCLASLVANRTH